MTFNHSGFNLAISKIIISLTVETYWLDVLLPNLVKRHFSDLKELISVMKESS